MWIGGGSSFAVATARGTRDPPLGQGERGIQTVLTHVFYHDVLIGEQSISKEIEHWYNETCLHR